MGVGSEVTLPQAGEVDFARFRKKARSFLREHEDNLALQKLRRGKPLTPTDLQQLEALLLGAGIGDQAQIERAAEQSHGLGKFIRSLVGLDRGAAVDAFSEFVSSGTSTASQIEFIDMIIEHLTHRGIMDPALLYESPFTDIAPSGPEQVFELPATRRLVAVLEGINESATAR
jgi:type I restriction enzyme R subunit